MDPHRSELRAARVPSDQQQQSRLQPLLQPGQEDGFFRRRGRYAHGQFYGLELVFRDEETGYLHLEDSSGSRNRGMTAPRVTLCEFEGPESFLAGPFRCHARVSSGRSFIGPVPSDNSVTAIKAGLRAPPSRKLFRRHCVKSTRVADFGSGSVSQELPCAECIHGCTWCWVWSPALLSARWRVICHGPRWLPVSSRIWLPAPAVKTPQQLTWQCSNFARRG